MGRRRIVPVILVAAVAALGSGTVSRAQDEQPPTKLRPGLHLVAGTKYAFEYTEKVSTKCDTTGPRSSSTHQDSVATWSVIVRLVEERDDGTAVVNVVLDRLRGEYESDSVEKMTFDSVLEQVRGDVGDAVGKESVLEVSPAGVVTKATGGALDAVSGSAADEQAAAACVVFQWLFPPLPGTELARGKKIVVEREFAPDMIISGIHKCGPIEQTLTIKGVADGIADLTLAAKGKSKPGKGADKDDNVAPTPTRWTIGGEAKIDLATGLYTSLTSKSSVDVFAQIAISKPALELHATFEVERSLRQVAAPDDE